MIAGARAPANLQERTRCAKKPASRRVFFACLPRHGDLAGIIPCMPVRDTLFPILLGNEWTQLAPSAQHMHREQLSWYALAGKPMSAPQATSRHAACADGQDCRRPAPSRHWRSSLHARATAKSTEATSRVATGGESSPSDRRSASSGSRRRTARTSTHRLSPTSRPAISDPKTPLAAISPTRGVIWLPFPEATKTKPAKRRVLIMTRCRAIRRA